MRLVHPERRGNAPGNPGDTPGCPDAGKRDALSGIDVATVAGRALERGRTSRKRVFHAHRHGDGPPDTSLQHRGAVNVS
jgi:hypothetical protein